MKITFFGAVKTTTGSMHLLETNGKRILLDCGLFQGKRKEAFEKNRNLPFATAGIDACILSHAHIDHSGNLPNLVKNGFSGKIFTTPATRDLAAIMLEDSAHLQEKDVWFVNKTRQKQGKALFEPLYTIEDAQKTQQLFEGIPYRKKTEIFPGISVTFLDAGHILGSAITLIEARENNSFKKLVFTGDLGRPRMPILKDPEPLPETDILVTESTYGNRTHPPLAGVKEKIAQLCATVFQRRSRLIIPAFSVGRTQQVLYFLNELYNAKKIPNLPVYVDSPLSLKATQVYSAHTDCYDEGARQLLVQGDDPFIPDFAIESMPGLPRSPAILKRLRGLNPGNSLNSTGRARLNPDEFNRSAHGANFADAKFGFTFKTLRFIESAEESKKLNSASGPMVIISASGMCEGGRILHHLAHSIENKNNIILIIGFQAENTLGRKLVEGISPVKIFGEEYRLRAEVVIINALSGHADKNELLDFCLGVKPGPKKVFVVHGELASSQALAENLKTTGINDVIIPDAGEEYPL